ncbi:hypothetical protein JX265_012226 [Neoarthrinium moseri]|uniref:Uncharacterized protein n=1 Tax=Neoarthrinium moseri TaxID=1658444 RepID=A0A9Q0AJU8_9PEZI|nr:uncharacterized protein JN550_006964 [Neoarthrinium moseri]KAI1843202.1 hypothetical protein JX266_010556 [Neoarthrinium moseri]KAI1855781.1 hypothetical protein JX265_012226 [Neoarthrinium moseri]KAI1867823.1 hypothetical protein JN550_006964 [Neoarthrinium moseri]
MELHPESVAQWREMWIDNDHDVAGHNNTPSTALASPGPPSVLARLKLVRATTVHDVGKGPECSLGQTGYGSILVGMVQRRTYSNRSGG